MENKYFAIKDPFGRWWKNPRGHTVFATKGSAINSWQSSVPHPTNPWMKAKWSEHQGQWEIVQVALHRIPND